MSIYWRGSSLANPTSPFGFQFLLEVRARQVSFQSVGFATQHLLLGLKVSAALYTPARFGACHPTSPLSASGLHGLLPDIRSPYISWKGSGFRFANPTSPFGVHLLLGFRARRIAGSSCCRCCCCCCGCSCCFCSSCYCFAF